MISIPIIRKNVPTFLFVFIFSVSCLASNIQKSYDIGVQKISEGHYRDGIKYLDKVIESKPNFAEAYINRGIAYSEAGMPIRAIQNYENALDIDPMAEDVYYNLGNAQVQAEMLNEAIVSYSNAIQENSSNGFAYGNRGNIYHRLGQDEKALSDINIAIKIFESSGNIEAATTAKEKKDMIRSQQSACSTSLLC